MIALIRFQSFLLIGQAICQLFKRAFILVWSYLKSVACLSLLTLKDFHWLVVQKTKQYDVIFL